MLGLYIISEEPICGIEFINTITFIPVPIGHPIRISGIMKKLKVYSNIPTINVVGKMEYINIKAFIPENKTIEIQPTIPIRA